MIIIIIIIYLPSRYVTLKYNLNHYIGNRKHKNLLIMFSLSLYHFVKVALFLYDDPSSNDDP